VSAGYPDAATTVETAVAASGYPAVRNGTIARRPFGLISRKADSSSLEDTGGGLPRERRVLAVTDARVIVGIAAPAGRLLELEVDQGVLAGPVVEADVVQEEARLGGVAEVAATRHEQAAEPGRHRQVGARVVGQPGHVQALAQAAARAGDDRERGL